MKPTTVDAIVVIERDGRKTTPPLEAGLLGGVAVQVGIGLSMGFVVMLLFSLLQIRSQRSA